MRPDRSNIPIPFFSPGTEWAGDEPAAAERLSAKGPVLVAFFEVGELSGVGMLPYLEAWRQNYEQAGLTVLGVHSPRSGLARETDRLAAAMTRIGIDFPVANDRRYLIWHDYGCKGWPSFFLWRRGGTLSWLGLGEQECVHAEAVLREELAQGTEEPLPEAVGILRAVDEPGVELVRPSEEAYPGGGLDQPWEPKPGEPLEIEYTGGACFAALDGQGTARVRGELGNVAELAVSAPGLYELDSHDRHGLHELTVELDPGIRVWSVSFAAGPR